VDTSGKKIKDFEKEFLHVFKQLCYSRSSWEVWSDLISAMACSLSNAADRTLGHFEQREKEYAQCIKRLGSVEKPAEMFSIIVMALEDNPEQDFLGKLYMNLNLGSHWKGQFFTPYSVCTMMSQINLKNVDRKIDEQGYISICDPACGAGATLIAAANSLKSSKYNFQNHVIFVGQDVDRVVAQMCYIQLSLLGCAEYICIGNTLTNPLNGPVLFPRETEKQELWYMPMFHSDIWQYRKLLNNKKCTYICDDVVYECAENKARKETEIKAKQKNEDKYKKAKTKEKPANKKSDIYKKEKLSKKQPKPKRSNKDIDGQIDMFSIMGM